MKRIIIFATLVFIQVNSTFSQNREYQICEIDGNNKGTITVAPPETFIDQFFNIILGKGKDKTKTLNCNDNINECDYIVWEKHISIKIKRRGSAARPRVITKIEMDKCGAYTIKDFDSPKYGKSTKVVATIPGRKSTVNNLSIFPDHKEADKSIKTPEKRLALLVGNELYTSMTELTTPINDVYSIRDSLSSLGFDTYVSKNLTSDRLKWFVDTFLVKIMVNYDAILFYYAGHGQIQKDVNGNDLDHIIPVDEKNPMPLTEVIYQLNRGQKVFIVYDACRNSENDCKPKRDEYTKDKNKVMSLFSVKEGLQAIDKYSGIDEFSPFAILFKSKIGQEGKDATEVFKEIKDSMKNYNDGGMSGDVCGEPGIIGFSFKPASGSSDTIPNDTVIAHSYLGCNTHYSYNSLHTIGGSIYWGRQFKLPFFLELGAGWSSVTNANNLYVYESTASLAPLYSVEYNGHIDLFARVGYNFEGNWYDLAPYVEITDAIYNGKKSVNTLEFSPNLRFTFSKGIRWDWYIVAGFSFPHMKFRYYKNDDPLSLDNWALRLQLGFNWNFSKRK